MRPPLSALKASLTALLLCGVVAAQGSPPAPVPVPQTAPTSPASPALADAELVFEEGSRLLKTFYFGFSGVDLNTLVATHRERLKVACKALYLPCPQGTGDQVLKELYRSVGDPHLYALTATEFQKRVERYEAAPQNVSTFGLTLGPKGTRGTLVQDVLTDSPAEKAGIVPGDLLSLVGGSGALYLDLERATTMTVQVRHGPQVREVTIRRADMLPTALPSLYRPASAPPGLHVLRIPSFAFTERVGPKVHELVREAQARGAVALIVDLRRGPGGSNYECEMAAAAFTGPFAYLVQTPRGNFPGGWLGTRSTDVAERAFFDVSAPVTQKHLAYELPDPALWKGKTVVLVDSRSASCHEYMAYFMQQKGIPVIGQETLGLLNTATVLMPLPGGGAAGVPVVRSAHPYGTLYPQRLTPNEYVSADWEGMANGQPDPMLKRAYELLK